MLTLQVQYVLKVLARLQSVHESLLLMPLETGSVADITANVLWLPEYMYMCVYVYACVCVCMYMHVSGCRG